MAAHCFNSLSHLVLHLLIELLEVSVDHLLHLTHLLLMLPLHFISGVVYDFSM